MHSCDKQVRDVTNTYTLQTTVPELHLSQVLLTCTCIWESACQKHLPYCMYHVQAHNKAPLDHVRAGHVEGQCQPELHTFTVHVQTMQNVPYSHIGGNCIWWFRDKLSVINIGGFNLAVAE